MDSASFNSSSTLDLTQTAAKAKRSHPELWAAAQNLEATFLSEMLKAAKIGAPREGFGGGIGEEQFASLLRSELATKMVESGGIGISENIFNALLERHADG